MSEPLPPERTYEESRYRFWALMSISWASAMTAVVGILAVEIFRLGAPVTLPGDVNPEGSRPPLTAAVVPGLPPGP